MRLQVIIFCLFLLQLFRASAQQDVYFFIDSVTIIGKISNNQVYTGPENIAYSLAGNMIYVGDTCTVETMLFAVDAKDILSKKTGVIFQSDLRTVQYITMHSSFYLGDHPVDREKDLLLRMEPMNDSIISVFSGITGDRIGIIEGKFTSQPQIAVAAHVYVKHFHLDDSVRLRQEDAVGAGVQGISWIHPYFDRGMYYEWSWDGTTLKPAWGYRPEDEWTFDGKYLRPVFSADPQSEWVWDGTMLKPFWDSGVEQQWVWQNGILKPNWDNNPDLQWTMEENLIRPMWRFNELEQWVVEGQVPLPVLTLVILGIADR